jgi:hypothetical protein
VSSSWAVNLAEERSIYTSREFNDEIGQAVIEAQMEVLPDEWKGDSLASSLMFNGAAHFHRPGVVYAVDLVVAVPNK